MAYQPQQPHEEGVAGPSGAVYYAQPPPPASPYPAHYGSPYAAPMHAYPHQQQQQMQHQQQQYMPPPYMTGIVAQQQVYYPQHPQQQQHGYVHPAAYGGGYAPYAMQGHHPQHPQQQHQPQPQQQQHHATHHQARLPAKPHVLPPSSPSAATLSPGAAHLGTHQRSSPRSALIPLPATSKLVGPAARLPALPPKAVIPEPDADDEVKLLRAALEAAEKREEAWEMRLEALGMQPALALQAHQTQLEQQEVDGETKEKEGGGEEKVAPVLGVRLLQRVHALQVENEELGRMLGRKLGLDEQEGETEQADAKGKELEDAMRLVTALDAALTRATSRAEQAERALAVACAQNSRSLLEDESLKLNAASVHVVHTNSGGARKATTALVSSGSVEATPTPSAEASTTASSSKSSPRTSLSALSSSGAITALTNGEDCAPATTAPVATPPTAGAATGRGRGRGAAQRGAQRGGAGRGSLPARGAWNTGRGA